MKYSMIRLFSRVFLAISIAAFLAVSFSPSPHASAADDKSDGESRHGVRHWPSRPYAPPPPERETRPQYSIDAGTIARVSVLIDGDRAPIYRYQGVYYVEGREGAKYSLLLNNRTGGRIKAVCAVDGLDIIDGRTASASYDRAGYVISPYSSSNVRGWRVSDSEVATFRFAPVSESYAMKTDRPSGIGTMSFAFFRERVYDDIIESQYYDHRKLEGSTGSPFDSAGYPHAAGRAGRPAASPSAPNASESKERSDSYRPGSPSPSIGTEFGESRYSGVRRTDFAERTGWPEEIVSLRYATHDDLARMGVFYDDYVIQKTYPVDDRRNPEYCRPPDDRK